MSQQLYLFACEWLQLNKFLLWSCCGHLYILLGLSIFFPMGLYLLTFPLIVKLAFQFAFIFKSCFSSFSYLKFTCISSENYLLFLLFWMFNFFKDFFWQNFKFFTYCMFSICLWTLIMIFSLGWRFTLLSGMLKWHVAWRRLPQAGPFSWKTALTCREGLCLLLAFESWAEGWRSYKVWICSLSLLF